jgi:hypothetical protein
MAPEHRREPQNVVAARWQPLNLDDMLAGVDSSGGRPCPGMVIAEIADLLAIEERIYFNARYYDPTIGRFITEDPSRKGTGWYTYCSNNPINRTDPTGMYDPDDPNRGQPAPYQESAPAAQYPSFTAATPEEIAQAMSFQNLSANSVQPSPSPIDPQKFLATARANLGQKYAAGINDCDIWGEANIVGSGGRTPSWWGPAVDTTVRQNISNMKSAGAAQPLSPTAPVPAGSYGVMMENSQYPKETGHFLSLIVGSSGSVTMLEMGGSSWSSVERTYTSVQDFLSRRSTGTRPDFHGFDEFYFFPLTK